MLVILFITLFGLSGFVNGCQPGWTMNKQLGRCYKFYLDHRDYMTWDDARYHCNELEAELVCITDVREQAFLQEKLPGFWVFGRHVWLGVWKSHRDGIWRCLNGTDIDIKRYHWSKGRPGKGRDAGDCLLVTSVGLYDEQCKTHAPFICATKVLTKSAKQVGKVKVCADATPEIIILAVMVAIFMVLSLVLFILYIRQRRKAIQDTPAHVYDRPVPPIGPEHVYQSYNNNAPSDKTTAHSDHIYDEPAKYEQTQRRKDRFVERGLEDSAYVDVRVDNKTYMQ